jgi:beta-aspartyl-dipeptidase (metallo-type)
MPILIVNARIFAPEPLGTCQVLVEGGRISSVAEHIDLSGSALSVVDAAGCWLLPGFVDALTHPCGGGGEGGFHNRTAEVDFEAFVRAGVTSPVGALGTDSITRSLEVLYGKVMELRRLGLAAYMYTGSYRVPVDTLTGDIARDLVLIDPVIGVGEIAVSDHRSSQPSAAELRRIAADARLGGTISGSGGTVMLHLGDGPAGLGPLYDALEGSDLPVSAFYPTHCNRSARLLAEAAKLACSGAWIDLTASTVPEFLEAGEVPALQALRQLIADGVPRDRISISSDAGGSLPHYDNGVLTGLDAAGPGVMLETVQAVLQEDRKVVADVVAALTRNPANALGLKDRGRIHVGASADLQLLHPETGALCHVMCGGHWLLRDGILNRPAGANRR